MVKHWKEMALGGFILTAGALLAYMSLTLGRFQFGETVKFTAVFNSAVGVVKDAPVMMAGIEVGHVESMEVRQGRALMHLVVNPDIKMFSDARAEIRSKSLLGEKYIAIDAGSAQAPPLPNGEQIKNTMTPVDLDEVLNHLAPVLTKLDPDDLNTLLHTFAVAVKGKEKDMGDLIKGTASLMRTVSGNENEIARIVKNLDGAAGQANRLLSRNGASIESIISNLRVASASLGTDAPELLRSLRAVSGEVHTITGPLSENGEQIAKRIDNISRDAEQFTDSLSRHPDLIPNLNTSLSELPPLLRKAPATLDRLPAVLDQLTPVLGNADKLMTKVGNSLERLDPVLDNANQLLNEKKIRQLLQDEGVKVNIEKFKLF
jgi:phospholipid/cholesterol/gamma-HCH transport system substrate-binding protein